MTGRENIHLNGALLGLSRRQVREKEESIIAFAGLELAVGDAAFQAKCLAKVRQFVEAGKTMLAVSHNPAMIRQLCRRAIWAGSWEVDDGRRHRRRY